MAETEKSTAEQPTIKFTYTKSPSFRVIKADGAWGTVSPHGDIIMSLFSERVPFPDTETYSVEKDGALELKDQERSSKGILREIEVAVSLDPLIAFNLKIWLERKIAQVEKDLGLHFQRTEQGGVEIIQQNLIGENTNEIQAKLET